MKPTVYHTGDMISGETTEHWERFGLGYLMYAVST